MSSPIWHTRRALLGALGVAAGVAALGGCETVAVAQPVGDGGTDDQSAPPSGRAPTVHSSSNDYHLGPADQLRITVFNEPGLTGLFVIGSQGTIAFPLVGDVQAAGLT